VNSVRCLNCLFRDGDVIMIEKCGEKFIGLLFYVCGVVYVCMGIQFSGLVLKVMRIFHF